MKESNIILGYDTNWLPVLGYQKRKYFTKKGLYWLIYIWYCQRIYKISCDVAPVCYDILKLTGEKDEKDIIGAISKIWNKIQPTKSQFILTGLKDTNWVMPYQILFGI